MLLQRLKCLIIMLLQCLIAMFKPVVRLNIFVDSVMNRKFKRTAFIWIIFCNNIKGFTVTFEYFNASLLSKSIHLLKTSDTKLLNSTVCYINTYIYFLHWLGHQKKPCWCQSILDLVDLVVFCLLFLLKSSKKPLPCSKNQLSCLIVRFKMIFFVPWNTKDHPGTHFSM